MANFQTKIDEIQEKIFRGDSFKIGSNHRTAWEINAVGLLGLIRAILDKKQSLNRALTHAVFWNSTDFETVLMGFKSAILQAKKSNRASASIFFS